MYENETSYLENKSAIFKDEFGDTTAPNLLVDDFRYWIENRKTIYNIGGDTRYLKSVVYQNRDVQKREQAHVRRINVCVEIIRIDSTNLNNCPLYRKYKAFLRDITLRRLKLVAHFLLACQTTPTTQTYRDWRKCQANAANGKYVEVLFKIIDSFK
jgi:hypothetical protein